MKSVFSAMLTIARREISTILARICSVHKFAKFSNALWTKLPVNIDETTHSATAVMTHSQTVSTNKSRDINKSNKLKYIFVDTVWIWSTRTEVQNTVTTDVRYKIKQLTRVKACETFAIWGQTCHEDEITQVSRYRLIIPTVAYRCKSLVWIGFSFFSSGKCAQPSVHTLL